MKHTGSSPGLLDYYMPHQNQNHPGNNTFNRPRPAGPVGYERGYYDDRNYYGPRPMANGYRAPYEPRGIRQNDRLPHRGGGGGDDRDLGVAMSNLTLGGGIRNRPPAEMRPRMQQNNFGQLPSPPINWINRPETGNNMHFRQQEMSPQNQHRQVYQVKTQVQPTQPE